MDTEGSLCDDISGGRLTLLRIVGIGGSERPPMDIFGDQGTYDKIPGEWLGVPQGIGGTPNIYIDKKQWGYSLF